MKNWQFYFIMWAILMSANMGAGWLFFGLALSEYREIWRALKS